MVLFMHIYLFLMTLFFKLVSGHVSFLCVLHVYLKYFNCFCCHLYLTMHHDIFCFYNCACTDQNYDANAPILSPLLLLLECIDKDAQLFIILVAVHTQYSSENTISSEAL